MSNEAEQVNDEIEELEQAPEVEAVEEAEDGEVVIELAGESQTPEEIEREKAPEWVKELRKSHRDVQRENRELQRKLSEMQVETKPTALSEKPTLSNCDYDEEDYETKLDKWKNDKAEIEAQDNLARQSSLKAEQEWQGQLDKYATSKASLKARDYEDAEAAALEALSVTQQGVLIQGSEDAAKVVYFLGKNPKKMAELAALKDPVKFAFAVAKLETLLTVTKRQPPPPEKTLTGSGKSTSALDSKLEQLMAEADKTGDRTKVAAYRRQMKSLK